ncbi:hypothetical protein EJ110_NYTH23337 [Nymphaea thermarum]|nr:hypothetical protein EJ110_NYTH23337 [Nymphaea thermarum]
MSTLLECVVLPFSPHTPSKLDLTPRSLCQRFFVMNTIHVLCALPTAASMKKKTIAINGVAAPHSPPQVARLIAIAGLMTILLAMLMWAFVKT